MAKQSTTQQPPPEYRLLYVPEESAGDTSIAWIGVQLTDALRDDLRQRANRLGAQLTADHQQEYLTVRLRQPELFLIDDGCLPGDCDEGLGSDGALGYQGPGLQTPADGVLVVDGVIRLTADYVSLEETQLGVRARSCVWIGLEGNHEELDRISSLSVTLEDFLGGVTDITETRSDA